MKSSMSLVNVHGHHNTGRPESTITQLAYLNVRLDALVEHIMAEFLLSSGTRNTMAIGLSDPNIITSVSIHEAPFHSNVAQSIAYEISECWILQYWDDQYLTHTAYWDEIDLK